MPSARRPIRRAHADSVQVALAAPERPTDSGSSCGGGPVVASRRMHQQRGGGGAAATGHQAHREVVPPSVIASAEEGQASSSIRAEEKETKADRLERMRASVLKVESAFSHPRRLHLALATMTYLLCLALHLIRWSTRA